MEIETAAQNQHTNEEDIEDKTQDSRSSLKLSHYFEQNASRPLVQIVNLDYNFAKFGTMMMIGRFLLSPFLPDNKTYQGDQPKNLLSFLDDSMLKLRQVCQYSIHARPSHISRPPDDIGADTIHNLEAAALGRRVYNLNAFLAPWLAPLKLFFPHSENAVIGIPGRLLHSFDEIIGKTTNLFWNIRRISKGLVPYDGGMSTEALSDKQKDIRKLISYYSNKWFIRPYKRLLEMITKKETDSFNKQLEWQEHLDKEDISRIISDAYNSLKGNIFALFSKEYKSPNNHNKYTEVGSEEPQNHKLYVRSKILSQILSLPAGLIGGASNSVSIVLNFIGNFFDHKGLLKTSNSLTHLANSLMAMVYLTGEIPANINEYFKRRNQTGEKDKRHLLLAGVGALGMLNRIKYAPAIGSLMNAFGIKGILDRFHNQFEKMFLGFFSANRLLLHEKEKKEATEVATASELDIANKHENPYKLLSLPFKVILGDKDVSYKEDTKHFYRDSNPDNLEL